jgi:hypothetical protein
LRSPKPIERLSVQLPEPIYEREPRSRQLQQNKKSKKILNSQRKAKEANTREKELANHCKYTLGGIHSFLDFDTFITKREELLHQYLQKEVV